MYESLTYRDSSWTYSYIPPISYAYTSHSRRARAACIAVSSCVKKPANARLRNWIRVPRAAAGRRRRASRQGRPAGAAGRRPRRKGS